jgi:hypothetical protein
MAPQGVRSQQNHIDDQHKAPYTGAKVPIEPETPPGVGCKNDEEGQSEVEEVPMKILQDQR